MADNGTDEQRLEALKEWWQENGRSVIAGVVLGVGSLVAWKGWDIYQEQQAMEASDRYNNIRSAILSQNTDSVAAQAQELKDNYSSTVYASWGALLLAKVKQSQDDQQAVIENLQWAIDNSKQETVKTLAQLRLARVYIAGKEYPKAEQLLDHIYPEAYTSLYQELVGDLHVQRGNYTQAREAYDAAIKASNEIDIEFLKMKRDNLGSSNKANV